MLSERTKAHPPVAPTVLTIVLMVIMGTIFLWLRDTSPAINDTIGYIHAATRMADGAGPTYDDAHNATIAPVFSMAAFQIQRPGEHLLYLGFPPGYPALLALVLGITQSPGAVHAVTPILGALVILAAFFLGAYATGNRWAGAWAALMVAVMPDLWRFSTAAWSDVPSMLAITAAAALFLAGRGRAGRAALLLTVAAGALLAYSIFIRYANVIVLPAFAAYDLWQARQRIFVSWSRYPFYVPIVLGVLAVPLFNNSYYGGPLITSYSHVHGWYPLPAFSWRYALGPSFVNGHSLAETGRTLWQNLGIALILAPLGWLRMPRANALLCALTALAILALYSTYAFAPAGINSRFLLPALPFLAVGAGYTVVLIGAKMPRPAWRTVAGAALALALLWPARGLTDELQARNAGYAATADRARTLAAATPSDAVFIAYALGDHIAFYGGRSVLNYRRIPTSDPALPGYHMEEVEPCLVGMVQQLLRAETPVYYVEDTSPPFWDSLAMLQRHFELQRVQDDLPLYQITGDRVPDAADELGPCPILRTQASAAQGLGKASRVGYNPPVQ